jgi:hypothetical protein
LLDRGDMGVVGTEAGKLGFKVIRGAADEEGKEE